MIAALKLEILSYKRVVLYILFKTFLCIGHLFSSHWINGKGQLISKCLFCIFNSSQKRMSKFDITTMVPQVELFLFVFWENWRHQKDISKLTDLYHYVKRDSITYYDWKHLSQVPKSCKPKNCIFVQNSKLLYCITYHFNWGKIPRFHVCMYNRPNVKRFASINLYCNYKTQWYNKKT